MCWCQVPRLKQYCCGSSQQLAGGSLPFVDRRKLRCVFLYQGPVYMAPARLVHCWLLCWFCKAYHAESAFIFLCVVRCVLVHQCVCGCCYILLGSSSQWYAQSAFQTVLLSCYLITQVHVHSALLPLNYPCSDWTGNLPACMPARSPGTERWPTLREGVCSSDVQIVVLRTEVSGMDLVAGQAWHLPLAPGLTAHHCTSAHVALL